ncbi:hypothetical protein [Celeribacter neptunius]|uniref:hypothetical protein n=1 Tax=Celeribacter neptunius TaxID=588602 RepID=UPI001160BB3B|nr:hypothetical protein [Celeribacter neptunius]
MKQPAVRRAFGAVGLAVLTIGAIWAVASLDLTWSSLSPVHLAVNFLVLTPALLIVAALTFRITISAVGRRISNARALQTVATANVAELLPIPGGALVRGAALIESGAGVGEATRLVLLTAVLTLSLTVTISAAALWVLDGAIWLWIAGGGFVAICGVLWLLSRSAAPRYLMAMVAVRLLSLIVTMLRLSMAFGALGAKIGWVEAALYAVAPTLGAAVGIVPAGLGVNEAIAAGLATLIQASPGTVFLAVAINRALDLAVGAGLVLLTTYWQRRR